LKEKKEAEEKERKEKIVVITEKIEALNKSISPDKKDDDLLVLIQERRKLEEELVSLNGTTPLYETVPEKSPEMSPLPVGEEILSEKEEIPVAPEESVTVPEKKEISQQNLSDNFPEALSRQKDDVGMETIVDTGMKEDSEFTRYVAQLEANTGSLGEFLQQLSLTAKQHKAFMLKVAEIDPAYAMHYADPGILKMDEDFNIRIAALDNPRNSGNALSEMLPNMRTSKVLLVAVKRDYRNIKFIESNMADYDEMIAIAKKSALKKISDLKEVADIDVLVPKILQKDKEFMVEAKALIEKK